MLFCFVPSTPQSHVHTSISFYSSLSHFFTVPFKKLFLRHLTSHIFHTYICKNEINEENKMRSKKSSMAHNFHRNCSNRTESSTIFLKIKHFEYVSFRERCCQFSVMAGSTYGRYGCFTSKCSEAWQCELQKNMTRCERPHFKCTIHGDLVASLRTKQRSN